MNARAKSAAIAAVSLPLLFLAIAATQSRIDSSVATATRQKEELILRSPQTIKRLSFGYDSLLADIYWTRAVQYYGTCAITPGSTFKMLWPLLDIATTLDPKLIPAYRFGAVFLSEKPRVGAGEPENALILINRGIAANPQDWQMNASLGFLYYWYLKDYEKSSAAYLVGSKNPEAPGWLRMMAARMAAKADSLETSKMIWSEVYNSTTNDNVKKNALQHLEGLHALQDTQLIDGMSEKYRTLNGHYPVSMQALLDSGLIRGIPVDPTGVPYVIGVDGKAAVGPTSNVVVETPPATPSQ